MVKARPFDDLPRMQGETPVPYFFPLFMAAIVIGVAVGWWLFGVING